MNINYNPATHPTPICWFNTNRLRGLELGSNEKIIKNTTKNNYPENTVCVKVQADDGQGKLTSLEITFVGVKQKTTWGAGWLPRKTFWVHKSYNRNAATGGVTRALDFDKITIKNDLDLNNLNNYMDYIHYILKQIKDAGLV